MEWALPAVVSLCLIAGVALAVAGWAAHMAQRAVIAVEALKSSTHNIQYVPLPDAASDKQLAEAMERGEIAEFDSIDDIHQRNGAIL